MIDYIGSFYSQNHNIDSFIRGIDSLLGIYSDLKVCVFPVYIAPQYWDRIKNGYHNFRLLTSNAGINFFEFTFQVKQREKKKELRGKVYILEDERYENIYTVVCLNLQNPNLFSKKIVSYFSKAYPRSVLTFITHKRLKNLLIKFRDKNGFDLTIVRATSHSRIDARFMTSVSWPKFTIERAFEWVANENGWFQNLTFKVCKPKTSNIEISISRSGIVKSNGHFRLIYEDFISDLSKVSYENVVFFSHRSRLDSPNRDIKPISIDFGDEQFADLQENEKFINSMRTMKASSLSVIHGNPYVHLYLSDYFDGSSFDIWVLSKDKLIIVPQLKASFQSIKRLINHIFDNYAEGNIENYEVK